MGHACPGLEHRRANEKSRGLHESTETCFDVPCFLDVRVTASLKVLQLELSPPHTPHLSSCFEEPNTPSQPTFCSQMGRKFQLSPPEQWLLTHPDAGRPLTSHSPRTHTLWGSLYEQRVPSRTTRSVRATARVSLDWQCRLQRLLAVRQTQQR